MLITFSVVLYNTNSEDLLKVVESIFKTPLQIKLYLVDNSITDKLKVLVNDDRIDFIHNPSNPGFGAAHNIAIKKAIEKGSKYHFIVNPDIYFLEDIISTMVSFMEADDTIGMMMPQVLNLDGTIQNLPKLLPSPLSILWRKLKRPAKQYQNFINKYELRTVADKQIYNSPILSGCFTIVRVNTFLEVGIFDDKFFMYFEDWDLSRRVHRHYKTLYFPLVSVFHGYDSGANKNGKLFKIFIQSAITYFNKWGWFFDSERNKINKEALCQFDS